MSEHTSSIFALHSIAFPFLFPSIYLIHVSTYHIISQDIKAHAYLSIFISEAGIGSGSLAGWLAVLNGFAFLGGESLVQRLAFLSALATEVRGGGGERG